MMDTDEEVTGGRVTLLNGNGPPYFHGYLYMKGECFLFLFSFLLSIKYSKWSLNCFSNTSLLPAPVPAGLMIPWRRRWCVLKDETFMWFRSKQESLKSGWLYKKGGGLSTLSRRLL